MVIDCIKEESYCATFGRAGSGPPLHFAHANGFPPGVYSKIFNMLAADFSVLALGFCIQTHCIHNCKHRVPEINSWHILADELITFLEHTKHHPVIGVGHSFGGVITMIAADKRPDLFTKLILLDPVILEPKIIKVIKTMNFLKQSHKFPLAARARKRRTQWASREEAHDFFIDRALFSGWDSEMFADYIKYGLTEIEEGVELTCSKEIEARIFETSPTDSWNFVKNIKLPALIIRGENSDVLTDASWKNFDKVNPKIKKVTLPGLGHLFPMQAPNRAVELIRDFAFAD